MTDHEEGPSPAVRERLAREKNVWLSTVRPNGTPHVTPVWFVFMRNGWWIGADRLSVKVRNIEQRPCVSLALEDGRFPVVAEGEAKLHDVFPSHVKDAFAAKYAWDVTVPYRPDGGRALLQIPVRRWLLTGTAQ